MSDIIQNLSVIQGRILQAATASGRNPADIKLLLATKTVSADGIKLALEAGYSLIGENKVQEVKEKFQALKGMPHESQFIGHLQSNKIKDILKHGVTCIQSLDNLEVATKLHQRLRFENKTIDVLIQVNTSNEVSKFGVHPDDAVALVKAVSVMDTIRIRGLMTIGLFSAEVGKVRMCFRLLKTLSAQIAQLGIPNVQMKELSMGMSGDLEVAIEEGATIVRVGTAIFGKRVYGDSYYWNEGGLLGSR